MADIFDVVADATRRDLLTRLLDLANDPGSPRGEISVGELVTATGISQPTVSKHLKVLREHGLVHVREEGQHRYYRLDPAPLREVEHFVAPFSDGDELDGLDGEDTLYSTAFSAWAGASDAGSRLGGVAAETAHTARSVVTQAQEALQDAQEFVTERIGRRRRD